jgi:hypothetical protein
MERRLRIRIEHVPFTHSNVLEKFNVTNEYVLEWCRNNNLIFPTNVIQFSANVCIMGYGYSSNITDNIEYSNVEINVNINIVTKLSSLLPQHTIILSAARSLYKNYVNFLETVSVTDFTHRNNFKIVNAPKIIKVHKKLFVGFPYRLYVNNQLITQKFYPGNLPNNEQLEETVFVNLSKGTHHVKLECLEKNNLKINAFACDDQIITDISVSKLSFQIQ